MQAAELSQALATGAVAAFMTSAPPATTPRSGSRSSTTTTLQAWLPKNAVFVSQKAFDALDKATQDAVLKAAADAEARGWKTSEDKDQGTGSSSSRPRTA
jgi:TRAP-type C4-dicarboxylate transport system substrate-binding protein